MLKGFRGDIDWLAQWEGYVGKPYWPGGNSGVTLDPGLDLGYAEVELIERALWFLGDREVVAVRRVLGLKGVEARDALRSDAELRAIKISRESADEVFRIVVEPYWENTVSVFSDLDAEDVPDEVQTAMLSLCYNRGPFNKRLRILEPMIREKDWKSLGESITKMQQNHKLRGIRRRRRAEGELILSALRTTEKEKAE